MNKSVYSIVLSDGVVEQIDRLAYRMGTSRSNMINQILAEYVSYTTPEKRLQSIFEKALERVAQLEQLQVLMQPTDTRLALKSALRYKYNPTVKYSVELYKSGDALGELKVTMRTQSRELISCMNGFFALWTAVEGQCLGSVPQYAIGDGKYTRILRRSEHTQSGEAVGQGIIDHVSLLDRCLKLYFAAIQQGSDPARQILSEYRKYTLSNSMLL